MVWTPTEKLHDEDSKCHVTDHVIYMTSDPSNSAVDEYLAIAKDKFGYGVEQVRNAQPLYNPTHKADY